MVLNAAARLIVGASRRDHILPVLRGVLRWLPVTQRIQFKIAATAFDCTRGTGPAYFKNIGTTVVDTSRRANSRSAKQQTYGRRQSIRPTIRYKPEIRVHYRRLQDSKKFY